MNNNKNINSSPKTIKILSSFTHSHVVSDLSFVEHLKKVFRLFVFYSIYLFSFYSLFKKSVLCELC